MLRKLAIFLTGLPVLLAILGQSLAPAQAEATAGDMIAAPEQSGTIGHITVFVEGEAVATRQTVTEDGEVRIDASPIFDALKGRVTLDDNRLKLLRYQDGARISIDMSDGKVRAGDTVLGKLPNWAAREVADTWLEANAIAVLTGCHVAKSDDGRMTFTLDDSLRPQFDLDLFVEGERLAFNTVEPRTIGPVLLIPLRPVAEALGHSVEEDHAAGTVTVTRVHDTAVFELNLSTGLVTVNGRPRGVTPNISYIEPFDLLLPFTAVETLTGTHILLKPGSNRIDVTLDDRLGGGALPGERVSEEAENTPLTLERLDFQLSDRGTNTAALHARLQGFNAVVRYETAGGINSPEELQPGWMSMDVRSLDGWQASLGDATPRLRELAGVDVSRIRGATWRERRNSGTIIAIAAGIPIAGSRAISESASLPEFEGAAAGVRLIDPDKGRELGVSLRTGTPGGSTRLVASYQKDIVTNIGEEGRAGLGGVFVSADVGAVENTLDLRGQVDARYRLSRNSSVRASLTHEGAGFVSRQRSGQDSETAAEANGADALQPELNGDPIETLLIDRKGAGSRSAASLSVDWRKREPIGALHNFATGARLTTTRQNGRLAHGASLAASGRLFRDGVDVSLDLGRSTAQTGDGREVSTVLAARALKRFDIGQVQASLSATRQDGETRRRLITTASARPIQHPLGRGASVSLTPSASFIADDNGYFTRAGAIASVDSGEALGERLSVRAQFSALQSVDPQRTRTDVFTNVAAQYQIFRNVQLEANYYEDFGRNRNLSLALRGSVAFNPPRKHSKPVDGRGVLQGRVFYDRNRDGVRQDDEPGLPGVRVSVRNTRLTLRVDNSGFFTIQNMKTGLFTLAIDRRSLPLGMLVDEEAVLRATIGDGRITTLDIPVSASGQIRGTVFVDNDGDGEAGPGDVRLEGARVTLTAPDNPDFEPVVQFAASFGQYAFEGLAPGHYQIEANMSDGRSLTRHVDLSEDDLFGRMAIPFVAVGATPGNAPPEDDSPAVEFVA